MNDFDNSVDAVQRMVKNNPGIDGTPGGDLDSNSAATPGENGGDLSRQSEVLSLDLDSIIQRAGEPPPIMQAAQRALTIIRDPEASVKELARVLLIDPAIAGLTLRWANSTFFGLTHPITTVQEAIPYLGFNTIKSLLLAASMSAYLRRSAIKYGLAPRELWRHMIGVAASTSLIMESEGSVAKDVAYHAGLLHDLGKMILGALPEAEQLTQVDWTEKPLVELEQEIFGFDHTTIGGELSQRWNLPSPITEAIRWHHQIQNAMPEHRRLVAAVHAADYAVLELGVGLGPSGRIHSISQSCVDELNWTGEDLPLIIEQAQNIISESQSFLQNLI